MAKFKEDMENDAIMAALNEMHDRLEEIKSGMSSQSIRMECLHMVTGGTAVSGSIHAKVVIEQADALAHYVLTGKTEKTDGE